MPLEDEVRDHLREKAAAIDIVPASIDTVRDRSEQRRRRAEFGALIAIFSVVVIGAVGYNALTGDDEPLDLATTEVPDEPALGVAEGASGQDVAAAPPEPTTASGGLDTAAGVPTQRRGDVSLGLTEWVVPWGDGFLSLGTVSEPQLLDAAPPRFEARVSPDGLTWSEPDAVIVPAGEAITHVASDGTRLVIGSQEWNPEEGQSTAITVSFTTDLRSWETTDVPVDTGSNGPDWVRVDSSVQSLAIGSDSWLLTTQSRGWIDVAALMPEGFLDENATYGWSAAPDGLSVEVWAEPDYAELPTRPTLPRQPAPDCCEPLSIKSFSWGELGIDYDTFLEYESGQVQESTAWVAAWGEEPLRAAIPAANGVDQVVGTDAGFVAHAWSTSQPGSTVMYSVDGLVWTNVESPVAPGWISGLFAVDGGIILSGSGDNGVADVWLGDPTASSWRPVDIPVLPERGYGGLYPAYAPSGRGLASVVDATAHGRAPSFGFSGFPVDKDGYTLTFGFSTAFDGFSLILIDRDGAVILDQSLAFDEVAGDDATYQGDGFTIDVDGDTVFFDVETGEELVRFTSQDMTRAASAAYEIQAAEAGYDLSERPYEPDLWLVATNNGVDWLVEDLDESESWPQGPVVNGDVVIVRVGPTWDRYELPR